MIKGPAGEATRDAHIRGCSVEPCLRRTAVWNSSVMFGLSWMQGGKGGDSKGEKGGAKGEGGKGGGEEDRSGYELVSGEWGCPVGRWGGLVSQTDVVAVRSQMKGVAVVHPGWWAEWVGWVQDRMGDEHAGRRDGWLEGKAGVVMVLGDSRRDFPGKDMERVVERVVTVRKDRGMRRMKVAVLSVGKDADVEWGVATAERDPDWGGESEWDEGQLEMMVQATWESKWSDEWRWWDTVGHEMRGALYEWGGAGMFGGGGVENVRVWDVKKDRERVGMFGEVSKRVEFKFRAKLGKIAEVLEMSGRWGLMVHPKWVMGVGERGGAGGGEWDAHLRHHPAMGMEWVEWVSLEEGARRRWRGRSVRWGDVDVEGVGDSWGGHRQFVWAGGSAGGAVGRNSVVEGEDVSG